MTRFCPAERWLRVRMRTRLRGAGSSRKVFACSHANKTSGSWKLEKGGCVFACEQTWGVGSSRKAPACSHANKTSGCWKLLKGLACSHANKTSGSWKLKKGVRVFACEQEPWLAFLSKWNFFLTASTIFMVGAVGADTSSFLAPSVSDSRFGFHPAWSHQSSLQASSLSCSGCPVAAVVPVSGSRSSAVSILRSSVVSGCRFFLVSVCRTLD